MVTTTTSGQPSRILPFVTAGMTLTVVVFMVYMVTRFAGVLVARKQELGQTNADLKRLDAIVADMGDRRIQIASFRLSLPPDYREVAQAIASLEALGRQQFLEMETTIDDDAKPEANGTHSLIVTQRLTGTYANVQAYLSGIARLPYHTRTETVSMDSAGARVSAVVETKLFIE